TTSPPWAVTAAAISGVSVATATRPIAASSARRSTWTIIGIPPISISGLAGSRVEAMRAGISTKVRESVIRKRQVGASGSKWEVIARRERCDGDSGKAGPLIRVARARANRYLTSAEGGGTKARFLRLSMAAAAAVENQKSRGA